MRANGASFLSGLEASAGQWRPLMGTRAVEAIILGGRLASLWGAGGGVCNIQRAIFRCSVSCCYFATCMDYDLQLCSDVCRASECRDLRGVAPPSIDVCAVPCIMGVWSARSGAGPGQSMRGGRCRGGGKAKGGRHCYGCDALD